MLQRVTTDPTQALSCAVCVVGQLARLELESKVPNRASRTRIPNHESMTRPPNTHLDPANPNPAHRRKVRHVVEPNLRAGHTIALLMVLSQVSASLAEPTLTLV